MKRGLAVTFVLVAVAAAAGLGWMAGQRVRSPDQIAYEAQPPEPSLITVEVELTELAADVITRADVGYDDPAALSLSGALGGQPSVLLVTSAPERGAELAEGSAAIEVSGRPVFLLIGEIPVFRDLRPKAKGPDVLQLEEALSRLGYFDLTPDDVWDPDTGAAAAAWYEAAGYAPNGVSEEEERRLETARDRVKTAADQVKTAENRVNTAADQVRTAENGVKTAEDAIDAAARTQASAVNTLARARSTLADAQKELADARKGPDDLDVRRARSAAASAREQLDFARADGRQRAAEAERAILSAEETREQSARDYTAAQARWQSAQDGVHPDGGTAPTPAQMEALRLAYERAGAELDAAERGIDEARASRDRKAVQAAAAVRGAEDGLAAAQKTLDDLLAPPDTTAQSRAVESARSGVESAVSGVEDAQKGVEDAQTGLVDAQKGVEDAQSGVVDAQSGLEDARADSADAEADLAKLESEVGIWIPAGELIFLERLPVRVDRLTAERGSTVSGSFMTVTGSELAVRGSVLVRDVSLVREGQEARIDDPLLVDPLVGEIRLVADRAGTRNVANDRHYLEITAEGIPDELVGANVKVVIPVGGTDGEVLAVPAAALSATADGSTRVEVEQPDGSTRFVVVDPGLAASGLVEVTPLDGELQEGDLVVVGVASGE